MKPLSWHGATIGQAASTGHVLPETIARHTTFPVMVSDEHLIIVLVGKGVRKSESVQQRLGEILIGR